MKRALLLLTAVLLVACVAGAQEILYRDTATFMWDALTLDLNGDPLLPTDVVEYDVYLDDGSAIDNQDPLQLTYVGRTSLTDMLITFPSRVSWWVGGQPIVTPAVGPEVYGTISWSSEPWPVTATGPFVYEPLLDGLGVLRGLRDSLQ